VDFDTLRLLIQIHCMCCALQLCNIMTSCYFQHLKHLVLHEDKKSYSYKTFGSGA